jgi:hypothetical protein
MAPQPSTPSTAGVEPACRRRAKHQRLAVPRDRSAMNDVLPSMDAFTPTMSTLSSAKCDTFSWDEERRRDVHIQHAGGRLEIEMQTDGSVGCREADDVEDLA